MDVGHSVDLSTICGKALFLRLELELTLLLLALAGDKGFRRQGLRRLPRHRPRLLRPLPRRLRDQCLQKPRARRPTTMHVE